MTESNNMFEDLIKRFHIKYGKLQISGYHGLAADPRRNRTVSPHSRFGAVRRSNQHTATSNVAQEYGYNASVPPNDTTADASGIALNSTAYAATTDNQGIPNPSPPMAYNETNIITEIPSGPTPEAEVGHEINEKSAQESLPRTQSVPEDQY